MDDEYEDEEPQPEIFDEEEPFADEEMEEQEFQVVDEGFPEELLEAAEGDDIPQEDEFPEEWGDAELADGPVDELAPDDVDENLDQELADGPVDELAPDDVDENLDQEPPGGSHWDLLQEPGYDQEVFSPLDEPDEDPGLFYEAEPHNDEDEDEGLADDGDQREEDRVELDAAEHLHDAVDSSMKIKKILEGAEEGPAAKRRRIDAYDDDEDDVQREAQPEKTAFLRALRLEHDAVSRYVLHSADLEEVENLRREHWHVITKHKKSAGEQLNDGLIRMREKKLPHGSIVDPIAAFEHRWQLKDANDKSLRKLTHKELRYVIRDYDGEEPLEEIIEKAKAADPDDTSSACGGRPGALTLGRFNRLELLDPSYMALVVGDANLTFSILLAQHRRDLGHTGKTIATTFEKLPTLRERYKEIDTTIKTLEDLDADVLHDVDCTRISVDKRFEAMLGKFGAVYYNFPHAGVVNRFFDGHPFVRWRHENLMHLFFRALRNFVKPGGSVKVASNERAQGVRFSDIMRAAQHNEFIHVETVPIEEWTLRAYNRSYGDKRDVTKRLKDGEVYRDQKIKTDMVYCFCYAPSGDFLSKPRVRLPPTKRDLLDCSEGALENLSGDRKRRKVDELIQLFKTYVEGIHVG
jgi:hypothetical protein